MVEEASREIGDNMVFRQLLLVFAWAVMFGLGPLEGASIPLDQSLDVSTGSTTPIYNETSDADVTT